MNKLLKIIIFLCISMSFAGENVTILFTNNSQQGRDVKIEFISYNKEANRYWNNKAYQKLIKANIPHATNYHTVCWYTAPNKDSSYPAIVNDYDYQNRANSLFLNLYNQKKISSTQSNGPLKIGARLLAVGSYIIPSQTGISINSETSADAGQGCKFADSYLAFVLTFNNIEHPMLLLDPSPNFGGFFPWSSEGHWKVIDLATKMVADMDHGWFSGSWTTDNNANHRGLNINVDDNGISVHSISISNNAFDHKETLNNLAATGGARLYGE